MTAYNRYSYVSMFHQTMERGHVVSPRGYEIKEVEDLTLILSPNDPFFGFKARKYDVNYFKKEMLWKLGASKYDESIKQHAKMWESVQNPDGTFNSNYGQYWFGDQMGLMKAYMELVRDKDSRRAVIPMLTDAHLGPDVKDTVCTMGVGFRIRDNRLNMSVYMRSSDQIFGLGTDVPTFCLLYRLMAAMISQHYPSVYGGTVVITAMSSHIYSRHYQMVQEIIAEPEGEYQEIVMPFCQTAQEAFDIIAFRGKHPKGLGPLADWLIGDEVVVVKPHTVDDEPF